MSAASLKLELESLLRERRLHADGPPLRGVRRLSPLSTGIVAIDDLLGGGLPRGQLSEVHGPASSGRTGLALALAARTTQAGALAAWVDPADRLDPASAAATGVDLTRLFWLRGDGRSLAKAASAVATLLGSGLFETLVLDLVGLPASELQRLPAATWIRLQRMAEGQSAALLLLAASHVARGPGGVSLALAAKGPLWSGAGPGRLLCGLDAEAHAGRLAKAALELRL